MTLTPGLDALPGRLGRPDSDLRSDPRTDPRLVRALAAFELDGPAAPPPVDRGAPMAARAEFCAAAEAGFEAVLGATVAGSPPVEGVERSTEAVTGVDGNEIPLYIHRPAGAAGPLPGVLHLHGGGMAILRGESPGYVRWRDELAAAGVVVVGVEYRNAAGLLGIHPFPAGLDDCSTALDWLHAQRDRLGISTVVVSGESGGANLTLATALKANREGRLGLIDGVYALSPYISGVYGGSEDERRRELPSLVENDGYFISCAMLDVLASMYDPDRAHDTDPLAWPYHATEDELAGMPPHVITVNELDPLRDEGVAYYRKLLRAGVPTSGQVVLGTSHAAHTIFRDALPDVYLSAVRDVARFAADL